ncbi:GDYXXLXY domain-containing protein [Psychroserpens sp.]|uniref:GDYXXLXY domain-containing protein n=1 Tax=Psychroserpens sp. TaxID=2020870 RepID=UPI001B1AD8CF|nr:GDYXXLXY domain-containing protein [Psychroserpens sp.]MBO6608001.1 GDYXXLXY domain-containing protein [Psychroserpens sp.]MBO6631869.1 GDYXXLXY domain-containing protein [Psychroserpens sp.]MBO6654872.1 GDYXXLXY domain-containing protein [Psychroserpens sp.]MBO6683054.1 GDYXXLXY domain-containing protein [Psychroserpens sp.]MBO6751359.1 GDYXXLXY domain-containing protein [Psychroserpens sp.]
MKTVHIVILFILVALVQLAIPTQMIMNRESILNNGQAFKFKTVPIDPSNPFKGKYISLNYANERVKTSTLNLKRGQEIYIVFELDSLGFVQPTDAVIEAPSTGYYVKAKAQYYDYDNKRMLYFNYPFDEFYMNENKAYEAEMAYREAQFDSLPNNAYALVYIKNGEAVLDNVFINDIPIIEYIKE